MACCLHSILPLDFDQASQAPLSSGRTESVKLRICLKTFLRFIHLAVVLGVHYNFQLIPVCPFQTMAILVSPRYKERAHYLIQIIVSLQLGLALLRCLLV